jgi:hypothetical protein
MRNEDGVWRGHLICLNGFKACPQIQVVSIWLTEGGNLAPVQPVSRRHKAVQVPLQITSLEPHVMIQPGVVLVTIAVSSGIYLVGLSSICY